MSMAKNNRNLSGLNAKSKWFSSSLLVILLYLMYSSTFLSNYLMNDERIFIGGISGDVASEISSYFFRYGRGLFGLYQKLVYDFVGFDTARMQFIRFVNFASIAIIAVVLLQFLERRMREKYYAFITILFFLSQLPFQALMGYSLQLFSNSQPAMWLSLLAFYLFFLAPNISRLSKLAQAGIVFIVLVLAMQSTQTYAFFGIIPVAYLALSDWENQKTKVLTFLFISLFVFVFSTLVYKVGLEFAFSPGEQEPYKRGAQSLSHLIEDPIKVMQVALSPYTYWSVFKFWSFPYPLQNTPPLKSIVEKIIALTIMALWFGTIFASILIEIRHVSKNQRFGIILKWLTVLGCFGMGAVFIIANSPLAAIDHRPHMLLTFSGLVIFIGAYAFGVLVAKYDFLQSSGIRFFISAVVILYAFGAQAGVLRNIVNNHARHIDFIRSELLTTNLDNYDTIIVITPNVRSCVTEPCGPWFGSITDGNWLMSQPGTYRYVLATIGEDPSKTEIIIDDKSYLNAVTVNWNIYAKTQQQQASYYQRKWLGNYLSFLIEE